MLACAMVCALVAIGCEHDPPFAADLAYRDARRNFEQGDLAGALAHANEGMRQLERADPAGAWRFRVQKAEVLIWQGTSRDALALLAPDPPASVSRDVLARRMMLQGIASNALQQFDAGERYLAEAARLADAGAPEVSGDIAISTGSMHFNRKNPERAEIEFQRALRIAREQQRPFLEANAHGSLGLVRMQRHQYAEAADEFQAAVALAKSVQARVSIEKSLGNLGWAYQNMGELDRAMELFTEAETQSQYYGIVKDQQIWLASLAAIQVARHDLDPAETNFRKALAISRHLENKQQIVYNLGGLVAIMAERNRLDEAHTLNQEAIALARAIGDRESELYALLSEADVAAKRQQRVEAEEMLRDVIRDANANLRLRAQAQARLATLHAAEGATALADQEYRDAILSIEQGRGVLGREEFKLPFSTNAKPIYDEYVGFLMARGDDGSACAIADLSRAQTLAEGLGLRSSFARSDFDAAGNRCAKPANGVVLAYWVAPARSYLWVLTPEAVHAVTLPGEAVLADLVTRYRKALAGPLDARQSANASGIELYAQLIAPAKPWIQERGPATAASEPTSASAPHVTIIPDGTLCSLNFETLLAPTPMPHYWIEDVSVANASAIAMLKVPAAARRAPKRLLLIGNPAASDRQYPPLAHATAEMTAIASHFPAGDQTMLTGAAATPSAYANAQPGDYDLIHFVAHGTASRPSPLDSAIVLSPDPSLASRSHNLYGRDIVRSALGARLVTISACDSAGTRTYSGEGLVGLSWAFLRAGAQEVIAALWEVNDASTAQLMDRLYAGIAAGQSPADALRAAKLAMLKSDTIYRRPFYWAPFIIYSGASRRA